MDQAEVNSVVDSVADMAAGALDSHKDQIIGASHSVLIRWGLERAWPSIVSQARGVARDATETILDRLARMTLADVATFIIVHAQSRGMTTGILTCCGDRDVLRDEPPVSPDSTDPSTEEYPVDAKHTQLANEITNDVQKQVAMDGLPSRGNKMGFAVAPAILMTLIPEAVKTTLDMTVKFGGAEIQAMADAGHDVIRKFVSEQVLEFVDHLVVSLEDVKKAGD